jgi:hypothetical protein
MQLKPSKLGVLALAYFHSPLHCFGKIVNLNLKRKTEKEIA